MSISTAPSPPLLLTKRLSAFLHTHQSPALPTLLLITPHGKLLAHASPHSVSLLRIHATVAASLLTIHAGCSGAIQGALPGSRGGSPEAEEGEDEERAQDEDEDEDEEDARFVRSRSLSPAQSYDDEGHGMRNLGEEDHYRGNWTEHEHENEHDHEHEIYNDGYEDHGRGATPREDASASASAGAKGAIQPGTITVQLTGGTIVIRRLACGLLFVCVGPPATSEPGTDLDTHTHTHTHLHTQAHSHTVYNHGQHAHSVIGSSPSEADSAMSAAAGGDGGGSSAGPAKGGPMTAMRKRAGELARRLDEKLGTLRVPGEAGLEIV